MPYLPFLEALRTAALAGYLADSSNLARELGSAASDLAHLVPDLREWLADLSASPSPDDPVEARYRLLQAVAAFLQRLATRTPLLLVLEDLQDADLGTLDLLVYLSRHIAQARLLVLGTYRDTEVDRSDSLARAIAAVRRRVPVDRVRLHGLTTDEVQHLVDGIAAQAGRVLPRGVATTVYAQTEGNPLFVWEVMRQRLDADRFFWGRPLTRLARPGSGMPSVRSRSRADHLASRASAPRPSDC